MNFLNSITNVYTLGREHYFHKIQYSKVFKHDISAAILGVVCGAFVVYLSLNSLGSGSPDSSDLTLIIWYFCILLFIIYFISINDVNNLYAFTIVFFIVYFFI